MKSKRHPPRSGPLKGGVPRRKGPNAEPAKVGYCSPPKRSRWKPGQSGNPKGRKKGQRNEASIIRELLNHKIEIREGNKVVKKTIHEAMIINFARNALKGDIKSATFLLDRHARNQQQNPPPDEIAPDDQSILDDFARKVLRDLKKDRGK